jgi:F-box-like
MPERIHDVTYPSSFHDDPYGWTYLEEDPTERIYYRPQQLDAISTGTVISNAALPSTSSESPPAQPPSKFFDKVNTNYIPSMAERQEIAEYVTTVNEELSELNTKITEMRTALMQVTRTRDRLQTAVNQHQALISPLRRLPPELLQVIFVWCLPSHRNAVMHASEAPVLLGRVCSEWRQISLSTPEVWSSLHIVPPNINFSNLTFSKARFKRKRELIEMWLGRSGACPLNISFVWFASDSEDAIKLCASLLEALIPMCGKWQMLDFQVPLKMLKPFTGLTVKDVPLLEGLSLMDNRTPLGIDVVDKWPESLMFAESAVNLKSFTLTFFSGGLRLPSIPWHQLTTLYLESNISFFFQDSREMLSTFAQCAHLQNCTLKFPLSHTASVPAFETLNLPITLPRLQVLCLDGDQHLQNTFHMSNTLINLCAPKLRKLEIFGRSGRPEGNVAPEPLVAIRMLLERSKCPLEILTVEAMSLLPEEFISCLKLVPTLVELVVHNWAVRVYDGPQHENADYDHLAENRILRALTIAASCPQRVPGSIVPALERRKLGRVEEEEEEEEEEEKVLEEESENKSGTKTWKDLSDNFSWDETLSSLTIPETLVSMPPPLPSSSSEFSDPALSVCPNLQCFDLSLCDASQAVLCDFVESRWVSPPPGVAHIKSIKCSFTAFEDEMVKMRLADFKAEGLDVLVTYQIPINDDSIPSPWTGLDAQGMSQP